MLPAQFKYIQDARVDGLELLMIKAITLIINISRDSNLNYETNLIIFLQETPKVVALFSIHITQINT